MLIKSPNLGRLSLNATNFADFSSVAFDGPVADGSGGGAGCMGNEDLPVGSGKESGGHRKELHSVILLSQRG